MALNSGYLTSTNTKNHITISISTHSYRAVVVNSINGTTYCNVYATFDIIL